MNYVESKFCLRQPKIHLKISEFKHTYTKLVMCIIQNYREEILELDK